MAGLSQVLIAPLVAKLSQKTDPRKMVVVGFTAFALGLWLNTSLTSQWQGGEFFWPQIIREFALLLCIVPATNIALGTLFLGALIFVPLLQRPQPVSAAAKKAAHWRRKST